MKVKLIEYLKRKFGLLQLLADTTTEVDTHSLAPACWVRTFTHYFFKLYHDGESVESFWQLLVYFHSSGFANRLSSLHLSLSFVFKHCTHTVLIKSWFAALHECVCSIIHPKEPSSFLIKQGWSAHDKLKACCSLRSLFFSFLSVFSSHISGILRTWEVNAALNQVLKAV